MSFTPGHFADRQEETPEPSTKLDVTVSDLPSKRFIPEPPEEKRCTAISTITGQRCRNWARNPTTVCRFHGAMAMKGPAVHTFRHGRYSKVLPQRLRGHFLAALNDPELENLRRQVAVCEARELELLARLDTGESGAAWRQIDKHFGLLMEAFSIGDSPEIKAQIKKVDELLTVGRDDERNWREIHENMEIRRRLVETERKRSEFLQANITPEMMAAFVSRITVLIAQEVKDRNILSRIADGIRSFAFGAKYINEAAVADVIEAGVEGEAEAARREAEEIAEFEEQARRAAASET